MSTTRSMLFGAVAYGLVSLIGYCLWAFPIPGLPKSEAVLYLSITVVFLFLSGLFLHPLVRGTKRLLRSYAAFIPAFLAYAVLWCLGWFGLGGNLGEIVGSALGLGALTAILLAVLRLQFSWFLPCLGVLFLLHTIGYTLGGLCYYSSNGNGLLSPVLEGHRTIGQLLWGLFHGLGFGAGLGYVFSRPGRSSVQALGG